MTTGFAAELWRCYAASDGEALDEAMLIWECDSCPAVKAFLQTEFGL
jgi:hypothetical protein